MIKIGSLVAAGVLMLGCSLDHGPTDNGRVTIHNHTDRDVRVYFQTEDDCSEFESSCVDGVALRENKRVVGPSDEYAVDVGLSGWEGVFEAVYGGVVHEYKVTVDLLDQGAVFLHTEDFVSEVAAALVPDPPEGVAAEGEPEPSGVDESSPAVAADEAPDDPGGSRGAPEPATTPGDS